MIDALTTFINGAGWLAPLYYIGSFVVTALLPLVPTPLVAALGGTAFGYGPAVAYGVIGLGLGAAVSLLLARTVGRPLLRRLVRPEVWANWEQLLGIRSVPIWGLMFLVTNLDFTVLIAGLTTLSLGRLWLAAMVARIPWLLLSAWFGDAVLVNDTIALVMAVMLIPFVYLLGKLRPAVQAWVLRFNSRSAPRPQVRIAAATSQVTQTRVEDIPDGVAQEVEANH